ncbi:carnosine N-methyltransferase-like [Saccoglossus kowalevskii]
MCSATNMAHSSNAAYQDNEEDRLEREHFQKVLRTFRKYKSHGIERVTKCQSDFQRLPQNHQKMLPDFIRHLGSIRTCIEHNYEFILQIVKNTDNMFENRVHGINTGFDLIVPLTSIEMDKVQTTLRQFVRDWSEDGQKERDTDYKPIIEEIMKRFPPDKCDVSKISVLVPGAGLGRLAYEIAGKGYICQGNEISLFMLFSSNFILNR